MKILILGVSGMLGQAVFKVLFNIRDHEVWGTLRSSKAISYFPEKYHSRLFSGVDVLNPDKLNNTFAIVKPEVVINCVGLINKYAEAEDPLIVLPINAMFPHRLSKLCELCGARLIHVSTDCVFLGDRGGYLESDISDAQELYGKSKYIGEVRDLPNAITLRTSIIGHELHSANGLVDWFLSQREVVKGYSRAIFSGLPTVELARVLSDYILPRPDLLGLYHISAKPITKLALLELIGAVYKKNITINADDSVRVDRSLNSERFYKATGYLAPDWKNLVELMYEYRSYE